MSAGIKTALIRISGGLGNQLFQLSAMLYATRQSPGVKVWLDTRFLDKYETVRSFEAGFVVTHLQGLVIAQSSLGMAGLISRLRVAKLLNTAFAGHACIGSTDRLKQLQGERCSWLVLDGYFQHPDLALPTSDRQNLFSKLSIEFSYLLERVPSASGLPRVAIHIRRGDFVTSKAASTVFKTIRLEYYRAAIKRFSPDSVFFVFGDDLEMTSAFAKEIGGVDVPSLDLSLKEDFMLMALCDHYIIANSTFSWWAAYLGQSDSKRVISPRQWYVDLRRSKENPLLLPYFELLDS